MKHVASRLVRYADKNKVIHADEILDVALRRLATDKTINHKIRSALSDIDPQLELLVPRQVDDPEKQFKRSLQRKFGLRVNLSILKEDYPSRYRKLQTYGPPSEVLLRWGLDYTYSSTISPNHFKELLGALYEGQQKISGLYKRDKKLYMAISHQAKKEGLSFKDYIETLGYHYE
ncbi:hypothetical protein MOC55_11990 [Bacillus spizizenii]|uniref:Uncharacterized protein n=1 Tax=Bacillus spizizenii TaxID=96241 RepID=A0A9Q4DLC7_BACSC|nr:hypothetical protein [Bacillus spizizenii]MCY8155188.1 hypothetical protein [Bacillus spizizenii]MCY8313008.1 hypothetical protein [Bacillus spizizenii]MCY8416577.1 hypothetical protein [Bacillus spizizenii]MCY9333651.1 hypothetical protein [Bacillus spizizenii]